MPAAKPNQSSMTLRFGWALTAIAVIAWAPGCASPGPRGELPFGEWAGRGTFVYERWVQDDQTDQHAEPQTIHRDYPTTLSIRPRQLDGREVIEMEILSERGQLEDLGDKTHLKLALVPGKRVSDHAVLYRGVDMLFNPKPDDKLSYEDHGPHYDASCITAGGTTVLHIHYTDNCLDTIRFRGNSVEKSGILINKDSGLIHWFEHLTHRK